MDELPVDIIVQVFESCASFSDAHALAVTCHRSYATGLGNDAGARILWRFWRDKILII